MPTVTQELISNPQGVIDNLEAKYFSENKQEWFECTLVSREEDGGIHVDIGGHKRFVPRHQLDSRLKPIQETAAAVQAEGTGVAVPVRPRLVEPLLGGDQEADFSEPDEDDELAERYNCDNCMFQLRPYKKKKPLLWLPRWTRPPMIMNLAKIFEKGKQPGIKGTGAIPLGVPAGEGIPWLWMVTGVRQLFSICYLVLIFNVAKCNPLGSSRVEYPVYPWAATMAIIPFGVVPAYIEAKCYQLVAVIKVQILGVPRITLPIYGKTKFFWYFTPWFLYMMASSFFSSMNEVSDASYLGLQLKFNFHCDHTFADVTWTQLWHQSFLQKIGLDRFVPPLVWCSILVWLLNLVPIAYALMQTIPRRGHQTNENGVPLKENYPLYSPMVFFDDDKAKKFISYEDNVADGVYKLVEVPDVDGPFFNSHKEKLSFGGYETLWVRDQNHGAALMELAAVNGMMLLLHNDLEYATRKVKAACHGARIRRGDWVWASPKACAGHLMSQVRRAIQHTFLSSALANGLQLQVQMTVLAMVQYNSPNGIQSVQAVMSIGFSLFSMIKQVHEAWLVRGTLKEWIPKVKLMEANAGAGAAALMDNHFSWQSLLRHPYHAIWGKHTGSDQLSSGLLKLNIGLTLCALLLLYAFAKLVGLVKCPYSLWNVTGCFCPNSAPVGLGSTCAEPDGK